MAAGRGGDYFIKKVTRKIEERGWKVVGITDIKTPEDLATLKRKYGEDLILVHFRVDDARIRFERLRKRGEM